MADGRKLDICFARHSELELFDVHCVYSRASWFIDGTVCYIVFYFIRAHGAVG